MLQDHVFVPTDNTNAHCLLPLNEYIDWCNKNLMKQAVPMDLAYLKEIKKQALDKRSEIENLISPSKYSYLRHTIKNKSIPTIKLLIKDHKPLDKNSEFHQGWWFRLLILLWVSRMSVTEVFVKSSIQTK